MAETIIQPLSPLVLFGETAPFPAGTAEAPLPYQASPGLPMELVMPSSGEIYGVQVVLFAPITAGEITLLPTIDTIPAAIALVLGIDARASRFLRNFGADRFFQEGDTVGVEAGSSAGLLPTPQNALLLTLWVVLNRGVSIDEQ